jgi:hypothetical protein
VVADHLVRRVVPELRFEPRCELLVQRRPLALGDRVVRRVAYEDVPEAERVVPWQRGAVGSDQLLADERQQVSAHLGALGLR